MMMPTPTTAIAVTRERQSRFARVAPRRAPDGAVALRVRVGRMLIETGRAVGGDQVDAALRQRAPVSPHAA
jgi:hypothetical protein